MFFGGVGSVCWTPSRSRVVQILARHGYGSVGRVQVDLIRNLYLRPCYTIKFASDEQDRDTLSCVYLSFITSSILSEHLSSQYHHGRKRILS